MKIHIKHMVCHRCKMVVEAILKTLDISYYTIELGEVELVENLTNNQQKQLTKELQAVGFDIINDKKATTIERIKNKIIDLIHHQNNSLEQPLSEYLARELLQNYALLSSLFSEVEHQTIEQYYIAQKIEKVKELLVYGELTLSQIALDLNYSSVAHLSKQFKKVTGLTPTYFKKLKDKKRKQIDGL